MQHAGFAEAAVIHAPALLAARRRPRPSAGGSGGEEGWHASGFFYISPDELAVQPMSGSAWTILVAASDTTLDDFSMLDNQDNNDPGIVLACAIRGVRANDSTYLTKARNGLASFKARFDTDCGVASNNYAAMTPRSGGNQWLALGRTMSLLVPAMDLLGLVPGESALADDCVAWVDGFLNGDIELENNTGGSFRTIEDEVWSSGSNASSQASYLYISMAAYRKRQAAFDFAWDKYRAFCGDRTSPEHGTISIEAPDGLSWSFVPSDPVGINEAGATKVVPTGLPGAGTTNNIDGAVVNDQRRGDAYQWPPVYTQYPWVGLLGTYGAALVFSRAGKPGWTLQDNALERAVEYQWYLQQQFGGDWWDDNRSSSVKHLCQLVYGVTRGAISFPSPGVGNCLNQCQYTHTTLAHCGAA